MPSTTPARCSASPTSGTSPRTCLFSSSACLESRSSRIARAALCPRPCRLIRFFRRRDLRRSRLSLLSSYAGQRLPDLGSPAHDDGVHVLCRDHHRGAHRSPDRCPVAATACAARRGVGRLLAADRRLRPYIVVQFLPLLVIPLVLLLFPSSFSSVALVWAMLGSYALSKALELGDDFTFAFGGLMSGHALKHAVAALSMYLFVLAVRTRAATTV
jgi:hypothetical protein